MPLLVARFQPDLLDIVAGMSVELGETWKNLKGVEFTIIRRTKNLVYYRTDRGIKKLKVMDLIKRCTRVDRDNE